MKLPEFSIGSFVLGIVIAISVYHGYIVYKLNSLVIITSNQVQVNNNRITSIETFLNNSIAKQQESIKVKNKVQKKIEQKDEK